MKHTHSMPFGASLLAEGGTQFRLWAPTQSRVSLERVDGDKADAFAMTPDAAGWHTLTLPDAAAGTRYRYRLPDGLAFPDPASRRNPDGVHEASEVVDPQAYAWQDDAWKGRPWHEAVIYELHIGTFTPEGTFAATQARLPELVALGITTVELMPLAAFPGARGWGYDGVLQYAPYAGYGTPTELKSLVDAAHALGLMVLIDVVYNHFGPEGNYLHAATPQFFNPAHQTPWGAAINYDGKDARTVRDFFVHNALYWIEEYRFDGLRMDAVHAIRDDSRPSIVAEVCAALRDGPGRDRHVHVVLENDLNEAHKLERDDDGRPLTATAQWNDDLHHAAHVMLSGETDGYYADYAQRPVTQFALALAQGFLYTGQPSVFRNGEPRGEPGRQLAPNAFVSYLQTHDQVGNRAFGERIDALADPVMVHAARACVLLSPHTPMLFMGEEYAARTPFQYFCDFGPELAAAVAKGRREEFGRFGAFADEAVRARIADPNSEAPFHESTLKWDERDRAPHALALAQTTKMLAVRQAELMPRWSGRSELAHWSCENDAPQLRWSLTDRNGATSQLHLLANFGTAPLRIPRPNGRAIYAEHADDNGTSGSELTLQPGAIWAAVEESVRGQ